MISILPILATFTEATEQTLAVLIFLKKMCSLTATAVGTEEAWIIWYESLGENISFAEDSHKCTKF